MDENQSQTRVQTQVGDKIWVTLLLITTTVLMVVFEVLLIGARGPLQYVHGTVALILSGGAIFLMLVKYVQRGEREVNLKNHALVYYYYVHHLERVWHTPTLMEALIIIVLLIHLSTACVDLIGRVHDRAMISTAFPTAYASVVLAMVVFDWLHASLEHY